MTVTRRRFLATAGAAGLAATAGCADAVRDSLSSRPAVVSPAARSGTGYGERTVEELVVDRTVGRFGIERTLEVTNWYAEYDRAVPLDAIGLSRPQAAVVTVLTTPQVSFFGRTFNPVGDHSTDELVELIQSQYDQLDDIRRVDESTVSMLGSDTALVRYAARARLVDAGTSLDVYLHVSEPVAHDDDFVIGVAVHPRSLGTEPETVRSLLEGVEHD